MKLKCTDIVKKDVERPNESNVNDGRNRPIARSLFHSKVDRLTVQDTWKSAPEDSDRVDDLNMDDNDIVGIAVSDNEGENRPIIQLQGLQVNSLQVNHHYVAQVTSLNGDEIEVKYWKNKRASFL